MHQERVQLAVNLMAARASGDAESIAIATRACNEYDAARDAAAAARRAFTRAKRQLNIEAAELCYLQHMNARAAANVAVREAEECEEIECIDLTNDEDDDDSPDALMQEEWAAAQSRAWALEYYGCEEEDDIQCEQPLGPIY
jgi:hypothetical protein